MQSRKRYHWPYPNNRHATCNSGRKSQHTKQPENILQQHASLLQYDNDHLILPKAIRLLTEAANASSTTSFALFPECVLLNRLDDIFQAWNESYDTLLISQKVSVANPSTGGFLGHSRAVVYDYDSYKYRSACLLIVMDILASKSNVRHFVSLVASSPGIPVTYQSADVHHQCTKQPEDHIYGKRSLSR